MTAPGRAARPRQRQQAIADGNRLILGPLLAEDVRAAAPVARRAGVPVIAFSNDESVAGDGVYIMGFTPDQSIGRVVSFARTQGSEQFWRAGSDRRFTANARRRRCSGGPEVAADGVAVDRDLTTGPRPRWRPPHGGSMRRVRSMRF